MSKLSAMETAFLMLESRETPMHIAALQVFQLPVKKRKGFVAELSDHLLRQRRVSPPFDQCLSMPRLKLDLPAWQVDSGFELDYHVRRVGLAGDGTDEDLMQLASRLHGQLLDRSRPLWEFYLIEGLAGDRFAIYFKIHQAAAAGRSASDWLQQMMSANRTDTLPNPFWRAKSLGKKSMTVASLPGLLFQGLSSVLRQVTSVPGVTRTLTGMARQAIRKEATTRIPYVAPKSALNGKNSGRRVVRFVSLPLKSVSRLAAVNQCGELEIFLAIVSGALRQRLLSSKKLPSAPLVASVPLSVLPVDADKQGEAVGALLCSLATDTKDAVGRLTVIQDSVHRAAESLQTMTTAGVSNYSMLIMAPFTLGQVLSFSARVKPAFNLFIALQAVSRQGKWFGSAERIQSLSLAQLFDGQGLNITATMTAKTLDVAVVGCPDVWAQAANFEQDILAVFEEFEASIPSKKGRARKSAAKG